MIIPSPQLRLDPRLALRLEEKRQQLDHYRPLPSGMVRKLHEQLRITITYHSNSIEGNSLDLTETRIAIESGLTVGGHPIKDYLEATNHAKAFDLITQLAQKKEPFTLDVVRELHRLIMEGVHEQAGEFRIRQVYITGAPHTPPPAREVQEYMDGWVAALERGDYAELNPVIRAAVAHHDFEYIHPFADGNGRTGRLLMNLLLMREGYPPALIHTDWRNRYIMALHQASSNRNYGPIINLVGRAAEISLDLYLEACAERLAEAPEEEYRSLPELAHESGWSANYLGLLLRQGRIAGIKRGRYWYSTRAALERYRQEVETNQYPSGRSKKTTAP
ncbi:MAG: Fic family protein [Chloroflexota bacterium]|nr:Fic family protein [Chloroflexota bacterium]